jgi:uncharacterized protein (TIGR03437 family)
MILAFPRARVATLLCVAAAVAHSAAATDYSHAQLAFEPNVGQATAGVKYVARGSRYSVELSTRGSEVILRAGREQNPQRIAITFPGSLATPKIAAMTRLPATANYFLGQNRKEWHAGVPTYERVRYEGVYPGIDLDYYATQDRLEYDFRIAPHAEPSKIRMRIQGAGRPHLDSSGDLAFDRDGGVFRQHKPVAYQERSGLRVPVIAAYRMTGNGDVALDLGTYDPALPLIVDPTISYATYLGGAGNDGISSIKVDATGALYVAGFTTSSTFKTTAGALQTGYKGRTQSQEYFGFGDAFVAKFSPTGALVYSTYLGGNSNDVATSIVIDGAGNAYVTGDTRSPDFPVTAGAAQTRFGGASADAFFSKGDAFVVKLSPDGGKLLYGTYIGGSMNDGAWAIAIDAAGNATVAGETLSTDFPTTANAISKTFSGSANISMTPSGDAFVARLNPSGSALLYSTYIGGRSHDLARGVALDAQGNTYVCGNTYSSNFPVTPGAYQTKFRGVETSSYDKAADDGWIMKISPQGTMVYSTYLGGSYRDDAFGIAVDSAGNAYVTGRTMSTDFPVTPGAVRMSYGGSGAVGQAGDVVQGDAYVTKLNPAGSALVYSTYLGGPGDDAGFDISLDGDGSAYVAGFTLSSNFPISADASQKIFGGFGGQGLDTGGPPPEGTLNLGDAFVTKLDASGAMIYSSYFGGSGDDVAMAIAVDSGKNIYIGGNTMSGNLPMANAVQGSYGGALTFFPRGDAFVARFDFGGKLAAAPAKISFSTSSPSSGNAGSTLAAPVTVNAVDAQGAPIAGVAISFSATNASVSPATVLTDGGGNASTTVTLGTTSGTAAVTASAAGLAPISLNLTVTTAPAGPVIRAVVNGASFMPVLAPGSWITIGGTGLAAVRADAGSVPLPTVLGNIRIRVNGTEIPLLVVLPTQINAQLPYEIQPGSAALTVELNGVNSAPFPITVQGTAPGVFVFGNNRAVAQNVADDGSLTVNTADNPVIPGKSLVVYLTGQGALDNAVPTGAVAAGSSLSRPQAAYSITIGGKAAIVDFLGMTPGQVALVQANVRVPAELTPGDYAVIVTIGGQQSNGPVITVGPRP